LIQTSCEILRGELDNLGVYRKRIEIIADILQAVKLDAKKTQIMFKANLSYKILMKYLTDLLKASLISFVQERQCYTLTEKGHKFLENYATYCRNNRRIKKTLDDMRYAKRNLEKLCPVNKTA
jgi:predicted transcriptional regulator